MLGMFICPHCGAKTVAWLAHSCPQMFDWALEEKEEDTEQEPKNDTTKGER